MESPWDLAHHSLHALGSRTLGLSSELSEVVPEDSETTIGWCDDQTEFEWGLDLLL